MSFFNPALLAGLAALAVPVLLHLLNRRTGKVMDWGAMQFLLESVVSRRTRIQLEEALLLAARCLVLALICLAVARPFVPPGSTVPWALVLPAFLLAVVSGTTALVLRTRRKWFWICSLTAFLLAALAAGAVLFEQRLNLKRFGPGGGKDIALVLDLSTSMQASQDGKGPANFASALAEARQVVEKAPPGSAFSLILAGTVPQAVLPEPVVNRLEVLAALNAVRPGRGRMAAFDALAAATVSLSRGSHASQEIIILTDGQSLGWELENTPRWESLTAGLATLPAVPRVVLRRFPLPASFRNAAVSEISYSRGVIGTDRPVAVEVTVENTGTEAITPGLVELRVEGQVLRDESVGQLPPGARQTVRFLHQFKQPGSAVVEAKTGAADDLAVDDGMSSVCRVVDRLRVLIVDGNPAGPFLERAASFTALALAPDLKISTTAPAGAEPKTAPLLDPEVMPLSRVVPVESFSPWQVVILCDVPRLPDSTARRLAAWVQAGGGLLVAPGRQAIPDFYNEWQAPDGGPLLPARLREERISKDSTGLKLDSLTDPSLAVVADARQSDLGGALFTRFWRLGPGGGAGAFTGAVLGSGDPFLTGRKSGMGMVILTCLNPDAAGSNLPSRRAFVPLMHQLVYHLANPAGQALNQAPARQLSFPLASGGAAGGLRGEYFKGRQLSGPVLVRIDGKTEFQWGNHSPGPGVPEDFTARWTGLLLPKFSEEYQFDGWGDDSLSLFIAGKPVFERGGEGRVRLEAGRSYPIRLEFFDRSGGASLQLYWRSESQRREVIPAESLSPFGADGPDPELAMGRWEVSGPEGAAGQADLLFTPGGLVARPRAALGPGLYRMAVPPDRAEAFRPVLAPDGSVPFTVTDDAGESRLSALTVADLAVLRQRLTLVEPASGEELLAALTGKQFGEELWKYPALGALFLLLAETALGRWIALNRQSGDGGEIPFENRREPSARFREQLARVQETTAPGRPS